MDLFLTNMQLFASQDVNWWTGVVWITCGLLWCFYQLFGLSFWRHPFTAEDPLVSKWCNATCLKICSDEERNSFTSWMGWWWVYFHQIFIFGWTIPLIKSGVGNVGPIEFSSNPNQTHLNKLIKVFRITGRWWFFFRVGAKQDWRWLRHSRTDVAYPWIKSF